MSTNNSIEGKDSNVRSFNCDAFVNSTVSKLFELFQFCKKHYRESHSAFFMHA